MKTTVILLLYAFPVICFIVALVALVPRQPRASRPISKEEWRRL